MAITAERIKALREETGIGVQEARAELEKRELIAALNGPLWFLHIRAVLYYLVQAR